MNLYSEKFHDRIYFSLLTVFAVALPLSNFITTSTLVLLTLNWIIGGNVKNKIKILLERKNVIIFLLLFFAHIVWLLNSSDFSYAFNDIKVKLPLLFLPLVVGTSKTIEFVNLRRIIYALTIGCLIASFVSLWVYFGFSGQTVTDTREISVFMSHIRFSLLINFSFFSLLFLALNRNTGLSKNERLLAALSAIWLMIFLFILKSFTGMSVLFITGLIVVIILTFRQKRIQVKFSLLFLIVAMLLVPSIYLKSRIDDFYVNDFEEDIENLEFITPDGNSYYHVKNPVRTENGHLVDIYLCEKELRDEWNKISSIGYEGKDRRSGEIRFTLIRYLTSLGLRKDGASVRKLTGEDIKNIENGVANYKYPDPLSLNARIYQVIWQIDTYLKGGNPDGHSITQRLEFLIAARNIIISNFWIGVGTGDLKSSFRDEYVRMDTRLQEKFRLRAHNQFVTFWVAFGIIGFILCVLAIILPPKLAGKYKDYFFLVFFIIALLSMLNEDTLEGQAGVAFFSYLYSIFVFGKKENHRL